jgi:ATP-binding protein involved in chromosome partitioning
MDNLAEISALAARISDGRAGGLRIADGRLTMALDVTGLTESGRDTLAQSLRDALSAATTVSEIRIAFTQAKRGRRLIAIASGKGGVGKSTLAANLAVAMATQGHRVGLVDADIYGPSQPHLLDQVAAQPAAHDGKLVPVLSRYGVPMLSMGQLAKPGQAVAWRGPMAGRALEQLVDAQWGDAETLLIDLPPGTGDIQLSMLQKFRPNGAVIVSTPQDLALIDAERAISLFTDAGVPIIGMVENMAGYACPHCHEISDPFGTGGAEADAAQRGIAFLGRIPLTRSIRLASDAGVPPATSDSGDGAAFHRIAEQVAAWTSPARSESSAHAA